MPDCLQELSSGCQTGLHVLIICIFFIFPIASVSLKFLTGVKKQTTKKPNQTQREKLHHHHPKAEHSSSWVADLAQTENTEGKSAFKQTVHNK